MTFTPAEQEVLQCLYDLTLRSGKFVPVKTLWLHWLKTAPGSHNKVFDDALKQLVQRGIVGAPHGEDAAVLAITEGGFAAVRRSQSNNANSAASGPVTNYNFNIGRIDSANGLGVFGDHAAIRALSPPGGRFDAIPVRHFDPKQPSGTPVGAQESTDKIARLTFVNTTEVDVESTMQVWANPGGADIAYHDEIGNAIASLEKQHRFAGDFIAQHTNPRASDKNTLGEDVKAHVKRIKSKLNDRLETNKRALNALLERIRIASIPQALAVKSLSSFGAFAALRLVIILKEGYDIVEGKRQFWFTEWNFNREHSPCVFDAVPHQSKSGFNAFGDLYFVLARVGAESTGSNPGAQLSVTMPFNIGKRLLLDLSKGDQEAYFVWVLPQLLLRGYEEANMVDFPVNAWVVDRLTGADGVEWHGYSQVCPWELNQSMLSYFS